MDEQMIDVEGDVESGRCTEAGDAWADALMEDEPPDSSQRTLNRDLQQMGEYAHRTPSYAPQNQAIRTNRVHRRLLPRRRDHRHTLISFAQIPPLVVLLPLSDATQPPHLFTPTLIFYHHILLENKVKYRIA